jgi:hypothetical protein
MRPHEEETINPNDTYLTYWFYNSSNCVNQSNFI